MCSVTFVHGLPALVAGTETRSNCASERTAYCTPGSRVVRRPDVRLHDVRARNGVAVPDPHLHVQAAVGRRRDRRRAPRPVARHREVRVRQAEPERELRRDALLVEEAVAGVDALRLAARAAGGAVQALRVRAERVARIERASSRCSPRSSRSGWPATSSPCGRSGWPGRAAGGPSRRRPPGRCSRPRAAPSRSAASPTRCPRRPTGGSTIVFGFAAATALIRFTWYWPMPATGEVGPEPSGTRLVVDEHDRHALAGRGCGRVGVVAVHARVREAEARGARSPASCR